MLAVGPGINTGHLSSASNLQYVNPVEITPFLKTGALRVNRRKKEKKDRAVLADTPENTALEAEVGARAKTVKCNRFSDTE
jgi:hypothetical protein